MSSTFPYSNHSAQNHIFSLLGFVVILLLVVAIVKFQSPEIETSKGYLINFNPQEGIFFT